METSLTEKNPRQGPCVCDDCGKAMAWEGIGWCITNFGYLLCSQCMRSWVRENRYLKVPTKNIGAFQMYIVAT